MQNFKNVNNKMLFPFIYFSPSYCNLFFFKKVIKHVINTFQKTNSSKRKTNTNIYFIFLKCHFPFQLNEENVIKTMI